MKGTLFIESPMPKFVEFCKKRNIKFRGVGQSSFTPYKYLVVPDYQTGQTNMLIGLRASLKTAPKKYIPLGMIID